MSLFSFIEAQLMKQDKKLFMKQDGAALVWLSFKNFKLYSKNYV